MAIYSLTINFKYLPSNIKRQVYTLTMGNDYFTKKLEPIKVTKQKPISQLLKEMSRTAYQGRKLGEAVDVWENMLKEKDLVIALGFAGSMSTAGQWTVINWLMENRFIDVLVSTGANVSEDIVDAMGLGYWQGSHMVNDEELLDADVNRYYDVFGKETDYREMEDLVTDYVMTCNQDYQYTSAEFLHGLGQFLNKKNIPAITAVAAANNVPIFSPAMVDSAYGETFLLAKNKGHNVHIDSVKEFDQFVQIGTKTKEVGVIYVGGGVPKDLTQLIAISVSPMTEDQGVQGRKGGLRKSLQEYYYPHKYAIQITTDSPQWGGLSGCTLEEAISWGKINSQTGTRAVCYCDATIALPLIAHALAERVPEKRNAPDMSWIFKDMPKA
ncbi:MAG: deoxyhypusine synthase family protein [Nitrososphaerota archaeon]|uniref:deoxyhypusine synthase family protein n=1 Tax=Candidatus Bathycorpusculum sp. TaxID=2994959 RepID=UPI002834A5AC|nr:deoxyhypusine synthase family protein [Candidatus Termitimicrobium sp.]MCL2431126.1 deoxyhypusine synthase family protein [Candidatus Termitimicrobium sp.]MDR0492923.1 deoxyhypusine synthase family protein [Nitrososphaerota archaeon]